MFGLGTWELIIVFAIVLVLFGAKRLPGLATGLGEAIRNFRGALRGDEDNPAHQIPKNSSDTQSKN